jgi:hypothetical protein
VKTEGYWSALQGLRTEYCEKQEKSQEIKEKRPANLLAVASHHPAHPETYQATSRQYYNLNPLTHGLKQP